MNLIWSESQLGYNISPADRAPARDVTVIVSTRYWVDSVHEDVPRPDRDYFARRADLFLGCTIPSILAQVTPPDRWLVLASPWVLDLPEMKAVIERLDGIPFAEILLVPEGRAFSSISRRWIQTHMATRRRSRNWLASVRLDNDDAIACDYVDALAKWITLAKPACPSTVVFPVGLQSDPDSDRLDIHATNHFTAVVSKPEAGVFDPYETPHTEIYRTSYPQTEVIYQLPTRFPMWIEVLHTDNAANHYRPGPVIDIDWTRFKPSTAPRKADTW